jgi:hypothetical protein
MVIEGSMDFEQYLEMLQAYVLPDLQTSRESFGMLLTYLSPKRIFGLYSGLEVQTRETRKVN